MSILVIGGNGFIGRRLLIRLLQDTRVSRVICMDLIPPREIFMRLIRSYADKFLFVRGDVSQLDDILTATKSFSIEKVINLSYLMTIETENMPRTAAKVNVLGMCNVFEGARLLGVSRVIYNSSNAVYGPQAQYGEREVTEFDDIHPKITYGLTKQLNEIMAAKYSDQYGISIVGIRAAHVFGHGREAAGVTKRFSGLVSQPAVGKPIFIEVPASERYPLVYVDDHAEFTKRLLFAPSPKHRIYNLAGPPISLGQIADQVRRYIPKAQIEFGHESGELNAARIISSARAKDEYGFCFTPPEAFVLEQINEAREEAGFPPINP